MLLQWAGGVYLLLAATAFTVRPCDYHCVPIYDERQLSRILQ
jgi:hypothetical protein